MESSANKKYVIERIFGEDGQLQSLIKLSQFSIKGNKVTGTGTMGKDLSFKLEGTQKDGSFDIMLDCQKAQQSLRLIGIQEYKDLISGDWAYKIGQQYNTDFDPRGKFLLKLESDNVRTLASASAQINSKDRDRVRPQIPMGAVPCFCLNQIFQFKEPIEPSIKSYTICKTCLSKDYQVYYSCSKYETQKECQFIMCQECYNNIEFINKMMLISRIRHAYKGNRTEWFQYVNYVMEVFRRIFADDPMTLLSIQLRKDHDYRWYEIYEMTQDTFEFKKLKELELYTNREILDEGNFHEVYLALQRRDFEQVQLPNGFIVLKEQFIEPNKNWVIKKVKEYKDIIEVPYDIAKQQVAVTLANAFNILLKQQFSGEDIFLKYVKPHLAIPMYNQAHRFVFELEDYQESTKYIKFESFNRPIGDKFSIVKSHPHFGPVRLPHTFSHWTYMVTGGLILITDIQGWKVEVGQYVMTDPVVFSDNKGLLGKGDLGKQGKINWIQNHECNDLCERISMERDESLISQIQTYLMKFQNKKIQEIMFELQIITGQQPQDPFK
ncbi:myosin heavy chain kinase a-like protein [Stylonychia lemnae]|uniref:Myosin heavy chain kinase a-like protein n=1 Tax=Stylonychia lemnae TaxID=5949 RepID=A0A077ZTV6_STYLE|nr:myosin heavy chain kinase a-like protein [Stylonychia lemnae]|eukprot:CDW73004.1 myosin heavy chain kinase a-like protein [Stylonychia lemnae]